MTCRLCTLSIDQRLHYTHTTMADYSAIMRRRKSKVNIHRGRLNLKRDVITKNNLQWKVNHLLLMLCIFICDLYLQFVAHPLLYKRLDMRWNLGLPDALKPCGKFRNFLFLLILIDTVLTPLVLPVIAYASYRDQKKVFRYLWCKRKEVSIRSNFAFVFDRGESFWIQWKAVNLAHWMMKDHV